ncbi:MAG: hypothetical protein IIV10_02850 [Alistipes sp.]|nr:hypothetical protein [Alistipes sp.]
MNRLSLSTAVQRVANAKGYDFHTVSAEYLPAFASTKPTILMLHPKFQKIEGQKHGKITHSLTIHALQNGAKLPHDARTAMLETLENDMLDLLTALSNESFVVAVEEINLTPSTLKMSVSGDVAITATCLLTTFF